MKTAPKVDPAAQEIMVQVLAKMEKRGETITHVARFTGKGYQQIWEWLNNRKGTPRFSNIELLRSYLALPDEPAKPQ